MTFCLDPTGQNLVTWHTQLQRSLGDVVSIYFVIFPTWQTLLLTPVIHYYDHTTILSFPPTACSSSSTTAD